MAILRDGSTTQDPRLDRLIEFDEASRDYPVRLMVANRWSRSFTWRVPQHLDQGQEGACVGFAWSHELLAFPRMVRDLTDQTARELYWAAQRIDQWPGGSYPGATPRYEGTSILAGAKATMATGHIEEYRWAFSLEDLVLALGYAGPAVLGLAWFQGMSHANVMGFIEPTGQQIGGHAILAYGVRIFLRPGAKYGKHTWADVDLNRSYVKLWNSWGSNWGARGSCYVTLVNMAKLLALQGEACIPTRA